MESLSRNENAMSNGNEIAIIVKNQKKNNKQVSFTTFPTFIFFFQMDVKTVTYLYTTSPDLHDLYRDPENENFLISWDGSNGTMQIKFHEENWRKFLNRVFFNDLKHQPLLCEWMFEMRSENLADDAKIVESMYAASWIKHHETEIVHVGTFKLYDKYKDRFDEKLPDALGVLYYPKDFAKNPTKTWVPFFTFEGTLFANLYGFMFTHGFVQILQRKCFNCKKPTPRFCGRCKRGIFCSPECQKKLWEMHRTSCHAPFHSTIPFDESVQFI